MAPVAIHLIRLCLVYASKQIIKKENKNAFLLKRAERHHKMNSFLSSSKAIALCELAPFQQMLTVAGFHRAHPSTTLNKSI